MERTTTAKQVIFTAETWQSTPDEKIETFTFDGWLLDNGLVLVTDNYEGDYLKPLDEVEPNGCAVLVSYEITDKTETFTEDELMEAVIRWDDAPEVLNGLF